MSLFGGKGDNQRMLTALEMRLIKAVFQTANLPRLDQIPIGDGVNGNGDAWTSSDWTISVGPQLFNTDLSRREPETLVHEMTHVWQYFNGTLTMSHAFKAQSWSWIKDKYLSVGWGSDDVKDHYLNKLYSYDVEEGTWDSMGFEGQAQMVEDWYSMGMKTEGYRFVFVKNVLWDGNRLARNMTRVELQARYQDLPEIDIEDARQVAHEGRPP